MTDERQRAMELDLSDALHAEHNALLDQKDGKGRLPGGKRARLQLVGMLLDALELWRDRDTIVRHAELMERCDDLIDQIACDTP